MCRCYVWHIISLNNEECSWECVCSWESWQVQKPFLVASKAHPYPAGNVAEKGNTDFSQSMKAPGDSQSSVAAWERARQKSDQWNQGRTILNTRNVSDLRYIWSVWPFSINNKNIEVKHCIVCDYCALSSSSCNQISRFITQCNITFSSS